MKKIISIFLAALIVCLILTSCNDSNENNGNTENTNDSIAGNISQSPNTLDITNTENLSERLYPELPETNFDGYEMKFLVRDNEYRVKEICVEEENGDPINDAVYKRNRIVEEKYGVSISSEAVEYPGTFIQKLINSGDCPYDVMIEATIDSVNLSAKNMLVDLKTVPHLDFSQPWWDGTLTKELTIGGKLFCNVSDLIVSDKDGTWAILFNKNLIQNYGFEDPYKLVTENKWTMGKFYEMSRSVSADLNGDGKYNVLDDMFGFCTEPYNIFVMAIGAGCQLAGKDENDLPVMSVNNQRFLTVYDKITEIHKDISTLNANTITGLPNAWYDGMIPAFSDGRILFYMGSIAAVPLFRGMEQDFGILPIPKFDEAQEKYYSTMSVYNNGAIYIPTTNTDLDRTGFLIEALSAESKYILIPAYYDVTLKTKLSRDDDSSVMLDIIFGSRINDIGAIYNFGGILDLVMGGKDDFVSGYEKIEEKANKAIQNLTDELLQ